MPGARSDHPVLPTGTNERSTIPRPLIIRHSRHRDRVAARTKLSSAERRRRRGAADANDIASRLAVDGRGADRDRARIGTRVDECRAGISDRSSPSGHGRRNCRRQGRGRRRGVDRERRGNCDRRSVGTRIHLKRRKIEPFKQLDHTFSLAYRLRISSLPKTDEDAATALAALATGIAHHSALYHTNDAPEISDADYDALVRRNSAIEAAFPHLIRTDSPRRLVGAAPAGHLAQVAHARPMMSLDNAFSDEVVVAFVARARRLDRQRTRLNSSHSCAPRLPSSA